VAVFADLVLEGGGVKGIALVGAISVLPERGLPVPAGGGHLGGDDRRVAGGGERRGG